MLNVKRNKVGNSRVFRLVINKYLYVVVLLPLVIGGILYTYFKTAIPTQKVNEPSKLLMHGDLNSDRTWNAEDKLILDSIVATPWQYSDEELAAVDINRNDAIDAEDIRVLGDLYSADNIYELSAPAPRVREFFRYQSIDQFVHRPAYVLQHSITADSPVAFLDALRTTSFASPYRQRLSQEILDETVRISSIYATRKNQLSEREQWFLNGEIEIIKQLYEAEQYFDLLLHLVLLTESGETLSTASQSMFIKNVRVLADDLRGYLMSAEYLAFKAGDASWQDVFASLDRLTSERVGIALNLETMESARDLAEIKNYIDRAEWQVYKSKSSKEDFRQLVSYAQNDRRYLRAVSNTSERHADTTLENHNLPMMLLFSEAMDIVGDDKKAAVGLLDEAIRIPFFWMKSLPDQLRPSSVALEHFLLPGNMEDGSDKSRHWNVFGGLSLYRTPEESLKLAYQREVEDVREANYSPAAMTEFIRDMIANLNGIYHVVSYREI